MLLMTMIYSAVHLCFWVLMLTLFFSQQWYMVSKTLAEEAAWKFAKEKGIDLVAINPSVVIGPLLQPTLNTSAGLISNLLNGICSLLY
jgi:nucleoside-diphosphate-sugar epimerase